MTGTGYAGKRFDGRYGGTLAASAGPREGRLPLGRIITPFRKVELATVEAVIRK